MTLESAFDLNICSDPKWGGKLAVLVDEYKSASEVDVPEWIVQQQENLDLPPYHLLSGVVIKSHSSQYEVGDKVLVRINKGLIISHNDPDIPSLGPLVPEGKTLRIYGRGEDPTDQAVLKVV